jgi:hypothetical protein
LIDALDEQRAGFVTFLAGFLQGERRIVPEGDAVAFATLRVAEVPGFAANRRDMEEKTIYFDR